VRAAAVLEAAALEMAMAQTSSEGCSSTCSDSSSSGNKESQTVSTTKKDIRGTLVVLANEGKGVLIFRWRWDNFDLVDGDDIHDSTTTV
jgi:hypothetical protein